MKDVREGRTSGRKNGGVILRKGFGGRFRLGCNSSLRRPLKGILNFFHTVLPTLRSQRIDELPIVLTCIGDSGPLVPFPFNPPSITLGNQLHSSTPPPPPIYFR